MKIKNSLFEEFHAVREMPQLRKRLEDTRVSVYL